MPHSLKPCNHTSLQASLEPTKGSWIEHFAERLGKWSQWVVVLVDVQTHPEVLMDCDLGSSTGEFAEAMATLAKLSKGSNYRVIQEDITHKLRRCLAKMPPPQALMLLCDSISAIVSARPPDAKAPAGEDSACEAQNSTGTAPFDAAREGAANTMAVHLLLDILPALCAALPADARRDTAVRQRTARLFAACLAPARERMAAKVAVGFGLDPPALHAARVLQDLPREGCGASAALGLLRQPPAAHTSGAISSFGPCMCVSGHATCKYMTASMAEGCYGSHASPVFTAAR